MGGSSTERSERSRFQSPIVCNCTALLSDTSAYITSSARNPEKSRCNDSTRWPERARARIATRRVLDDVRFVCEETRGRFEWFAKLVSAAPTSSPPRSLYLMAQATSWAQSRSHASSTSPVSLWTSWMCGAAAMLRRVRVLRTPRYSPCPLCNSFSASSVYSPHAAPSLLVS